MEKRGVRVTVILAGLASTGTSPFGFQSGPNIGLAGNQVPGSNSGPFGAYLPKFGGGEFNIYGSNSTFGNEYIWDPEKWEWIKISTVGEEYYHNYIVGRWNENGAYQVLYNLDYNPKQDWRINGTLFTEAQVFKMGLYDKNLSKYLLKSDYGVEYMKYSIRNNPNSEFFLTYGSMLIMGFVSPTSYVPLAVRGGVGAINLAKGVQVATAAKGGGQLSKYSGILRDAAKYKGNFGLGKGTASEALELGRAWVGKGYTTARNGKILISKNGLRQFRMPSYKPKLGIQQANFEWRNVARGRWQGNGHLDIIK